MKQKLFLENAGGYSTLLNSVSRFSFLKRASLLFLLLMAVFRFNTLGQCSVQNITTNTTWNSTQNIFHEVHVQSGATLTITGNITITFMSTCAGIVVETGGRLIANNGAKLTKFSPGNYLWRGIEAKFSAITSVNLQNCTVEYAQTAVKLLSGSSGIVFYSAKIYALNVNFNNNQIAISKTGSDTSPTQSDLVNCTFTTASVESGTLTSPVTYIELNNSDVVNIQAGFSNNTNAAYWVKGIVATGSSGLGIMVNNSTFDKIEKGIYIENGSFIRTIKNSSFTNIPTPAYTVCGGAFCTVYGDTYGIMAVASKVNAKDNTFGGVQRHQLNPKRAYGIVFDNTASGGSMSFRNTFSGMDVGFQSQLNNIQAVVSCNNFNGFAPSLFANRTYSWITVGGGSAFMRNQGLVDGSNNAQCGTRTTQAGNEWSTLCSGSSHDVDIRVTSGLPFYYASHTVLSTGGEYPKPNCSTTAWKNTYLKACLWPTTGYTKDATSCVTPFAYPPGFTKNDEEVGINIFEEPENYFDAAASFIASINVNANNADAGALNELFYYRGAMQWASNEVVAKLLSAGDGQAAMEWLAKSPLTDDARTYCELLLARGDYAAAREAANDFVQKVDATVHESKTFSDFYNADAAQYAALIYLIADILERGGEAKEEELAALEEFRKLTSETGVRATGFVRQLTGKGDYYEPIYVPDDEESYKNLSVDGSENLIKVAPNPSSGRFLIEYSLAEETTSAEFILTDLSGREVYSTKLPLHVITFEVNTAQLNPGIYLYRFKENNNTTQNGKIILLN